MHIAHIFEITDRDTVSDAWFMTVSLLDMLERSQQIGDYYNFREARLKVEKIYAIAEAHGIDKKHHDCLCGLSAAEHQLLERKVMKFFKLQIASLKHFIY